MTDGSRRDRGAEALRREFDAGFASPPLVPAPQADVLAIRVDERRHFLRLSEISALHAAPAVTPVPSAVPELVGIAAVRSTLLPVLDLHSLLGFAAAERPRWLIVVGSPPLALVFADLEEQLRLPAASMVARQTSGQDLVAALATTDAGSVPVVDLSGLHAEVTRRVRAAMAPQEPR